MIVIDASAMVELVVGGTPRAAKLAARLAGAASLHAPHLIDLEVTSVLRSLEARGQVTAATAGHALVQLLSVDLTRYSHEILLPRIWQLRGHLTAYDASYVALAENLSAPLVTCDAKLAAAPGHRAVVEHF